MTKIRLFFLSIILIFGISLVGFLFTKEVKTEYESTLAPFFQTMGITTKTIDRVVTRIMPVDSYDEKDYRKIIKARYSQSLFENTEDYRYLNNLIFNLKEFQIKPFEYEVFIMKSSSPNAFALPGGVIFVTTSLLKILETEGELVSILLHEIGHIELSHCFDHVRFEMLSKKINKQTSSGEIADIIFYILANHSFSKTIENEADDFAYRNLLKTEYNPESMSKAFEKLQNYIESHNLQEENNEADILTDYLSTHPLLKLRIEKYQALAKKWWHKNKTAKRYSGKQNLKERKTFFEENFKNSEWITNK